jgi:hypothetical protein
MNAGRWITVLGVVAGVVIGGVYAASATGSYSATVTLGPAQPHHPDATDGITLLPCVARPLTVETLVVSRSALAYAASAAHMTVVQLKGHLHVRVARNMFVEITVTAARHERAANAAAALGGYVASETGGSYVVTKDARKSITAMC